MDNTRNEHREVCFIEIDADHGVWQCSGCGHIARFEANDPIDNGWTVCPACAGKITELEDADHEND